MVIYMTFVIKRHAEFVIFGVKESYMYMYLASQHTVNT